MLTFNRAIILAAAVALASALACGGGGDDDNGNTPDSVTLDAADVPDVHGNPDESEPCDARDVVDGNTAGDADAIDNPDGVHPDADSPDTPDTPDPDAADAGDDVPDTAECAAALPLTCGDSFAHSTVTNGRANLWSAYNCTARLENGREAVYRFEYENDCLVTITLSNLATDLDVMHLKTCDPFSADKCQSTPLDIQDDETIAFLVDGGAPTYVVVDGYDGHEGDYTIDASCDCGEPLEYRSELAECAFQFVDSTVSTPAAPDSAPCLPEPCETDADCSAIDTVGAGQVCAAGNCVYCAQDTDCPESLLCRGGRCVQDGWAACPEIPDCAAAGCVAIEMSETSCPVCVCTTEFFNNCAVDDDCLVISHHPFQRCVSGRCAECRVDAHCGYPGLQCLPPGMCMSMLTHPSALYGSWIIGWYQGFNHFSYFRFEPDGTLRRATYDTTGEADWADEIFLGNCPGAYENGMPEQFVGTWEPVMTESGFLVIAVDFQAICNPGAPELTRWMVTMDESGDGFTMKSVEYPEGVQLTGIRVEPNIFCNSEFTSCIAPDLALF